MKKHIVLMVFALLMAVAPVFGWAGETALAATAPEEVVLNETNIVIDLAKTSKAYLSADVLPASASQRIKWSTSSSSIAKVSSSGVITARKRGTAVITATAYRTNVSQKCTVTVINSNYPTDIELDMSQLTMYRYETCQLTPTVSPSTADQSVKWKSSKSSVVSVSSKGVLTAKKAGTATITCYSSRDKTILDTVTVKVLQQDTPQSISLTPDTDVMVLGSTLQLKAQQYPSSACGFFEWRTSSSSRAAVTKDGLVTAKRTGWVTITCQSKQSSKIKATRKILVVTASSPHEIDPGMAELTLYKGQSQKLTTKVLPAGKDSSVSYKSSKSSVAQVDSNGVITARKAGTATITITSRANKYVTATVKVTVRNLPAPQSLSINAPASTIAKGDSIRLTAVPYPENTSSAVTWKSSNTSVARVSSSGEVEGRKGGTAVITAISQEDSSVKATCTITVSDPKSPTAIQLNETFITMEIGETRAMEAKVIPETGVSTGVKWSSSSSSVAKVSSGGVITARKAGSAVISAASSYNSSISSSVMVNVVNRAAPTSLKATCDSTQMAIGQTMQIDVSPVPSSASRLYKYASSDKAVVSVSESGLLTAKKAGSAVITIKSGKNSSVSTTLQIFVYDDTTPRSLTLSNTVMYLGEDDTVTLKATVKPDNAQQAVTWRSSNTSVATVSDSGQVRARTSGTAVITCTTKKGGLTATCTINVLDTTLATAIPARTTKVDGIAANLAKIEAIRKSAANQVLSLNMKGQISSSESAARQAVINRAFEMQAFPWMTKEVQEYWNKAYSYKRYVPDTVYYGMPYIQTGPSNGYLNRRYNVEKALDEKRYTSTGKGYYLLNRSKLVDGFYVGNDCSSFVSMSQFGTEHAASYLNTTSIAKSSYYRTIGSYDQLRPGDLLVKAGDHTVLFLYYVDAAKTRMMIIEQGGNGSTVICSIFDRSWFESRGYVARRQKTFS